MQNYIIFCNISVENSFKKVNSWEQRVLLAYDNNKLLSLWLHIARWLVPNTIGVYQQHHWCLLTAPLVFANSTIGDEHEHIVRKQ